MIIYLCGVPRAGKTTTAKKLNKALPYSNIIVSEAVRNGFQKIYPQEAKAWGNKTSSQRTLLFPAFLQEFASWNESFTDTATIVDCALVDVQTILDTKREQDIVICLGWGGKDTSDILALIHQHEGDSYTKQVPDEKLLTLWGDIGSIDKQNIVICKNNNIKYYDTSIDRERVINLIIKNIQAL